MFLISIFSSFEYILTLLIIFSTFEFCENFFVSKHCLQQNKNLVNASYISYEMIAIDSEVKEKNLIFMNEIGLDPWIDDIVAIKVIDDRQNSNSKINAYESLCGDVLSPDAFDNLLLYKFSKFLRRSLSEIRNSVIFLKVDAEIEIKEYQVLITNNCGKGFSKKV